MKKFLLLFLVCFSFTVLAKAENGSITGKVIDKSTKEALPGVNILIVGTNIGTSTNLNGEFIIDNLNAGIYAVQASFIGYNRITKTDVIVNSARPADILFEMTTAVIELDGVTVTFEFFNNEPTELNSITSFSYEEIRRAPGGFEDVVRALSVLPGVAKQSAGRNDLVVRGGAPSENLYLVDGFVVPNINHFGNQGATGGPLSFINLDFVNETTFSTGGFSAIYGDKLSSVLSIDLREGRNDRIGGKGTISASQFGLNLEGPISSNSDFLFSVRRSYLDFIFNAAGFNFVPEYWDVLSKFNFDADNKNKFSFLFVGAFDNVKFNNETSEDIYENSRILGSNQNQYLAGFSYRHLFNDGFYTIRLSRNFTDFDSSQRDTLFNPIFLNQSREGENELKGDLVYKLSPNSEFSFGASVKNIKFSADILLPNFITSFGDTLSITNLSTERRYTKSAFYSQFSSVLFNRLRLNAGLRLDYFDAINTKFYLSPRFSLSYKLTELTTLSASTGIYYQSPSYIWLAADARNKDLTSVKVNQFVVGIEHLLRADTRIKLEGFYKDYKDYPASKLRNYLVLANTGAGFGGGDDNFSSFGLEHLVSEGFGYSRGLELSAQKKSSEVPHYAIMSLTYSETKYTPLDGIERYGSYDQRWIFNLSGGYIFDEKWEAAIKFRMATGNPYTPFNNNGTQSPILYNTARFDLQHSLDVRVDRRWDFDGWTLITYLDIQNIYNQKNVSTIRWDYRTNSIDENSEIGILPSIGISVEF